MTGASNPASALTRFNLAKAKVLAVDDNAQALAILSQILLGFAVGLASKCATAAEARLLLERETYNLVILDDHLPGESGFELAEWIRREPKSRNFTVPITAMTYSLRTLLALSCAAASRSRLSTTWVTPVRSRKSIKMRLPRSRRRFTHPMSTAFLPASEGRSVPHI